MAHSKCSGLWMGYPLEFSGFVWPTLSAACGGWGTRWNSAVWFGPLGVQWVVDGVPAGIQRFGLAHSECSGLWMGYLLEFSGLVWPPLSVAGGPLCDHPPNNKIATNPCQARAQCCNCCMCVYQGEGTQPPSLLSPPGAGSVQLCNAMEAESCPTPHPSPLLASWETADRLPNQTICPTRDC